MNGIEWELPNGLLPPDAVRSFSDSFGKIEAIVLEKLSIDLSSLRRRDFESRRDFWSHGEPGSLEAFLQDLQSRFGGTLLAVFRLGLYDALAEETAALAAELRSRGAPAGFAGNMLNAWIVAIHGCVPAPQARALVQLLERVKRHPLEAGTEPQERRATEAPVDEAAWAPFLSVLLSLGEGEAERHLLDLLASGVSLERICVETIFPAMRELGALWQRNKLTVSEEHAATGKLRRAVYVLFGRAAREPRRALGVAVTCAPGDEHEIGAEIYALYLETKGWPVLFLGHSAPMADVLLAIGGSKPFALVLSATLIAHLPAAVDLAARARERAPGVKIIAGGLAVVRAEKALLNTIDAVARTPEGCHAALERMAKNAGEGP